MPPKSQSGVEPHSKADGTRSVPATLGRYELREQVGHGGFATVWRAYDPELRREVAIKVPRPELIGAPGFRERIEREVQAAARLRHPAIVPIFEVGHAGNESDEGRGGGATFIVYEFIAGSTLAMLLGQTKPSPRQAAEWIVTLAEALDYAHQNGIVHRDIKPANVMMRELEGRGLRVEGQQGRLDDNTNPSAPNPQRSSVNSQLTSLRPMLADFGLALHADAGATLTQQGDILGTPAYMSPEQARGEGHSVDARTDVYSLGVMLYEMLAGRRPFEGSGASVLQRVLDEEPPALRSVRPGVSLDLETICQRAMAKESSRRYTTAGAMAADLRAWLEHRPIRARRVGALGRFALWCRRKPALAATIAVAAGVCLIVAGTSFYRVIAERDRAEGERDRAQLLAATYAFERGIQQCEAGEPAIGLLWFVRSLELAPSGANDLQWAIRANLDAWHRLVPRQRLVIQSPEKVTRAVVSGDGRLVAWGTEDGSLRVWDLQSGRAMGEPIELGSKIVHLAASQDGQVLLCWNHVQGEVRWWRSGQSASSAAAHTDSSSSVPALVDTQRRSSPQCALSADGRYALAGTRLLNLSSGESVELPVSGTTEGAFRSDGSVVATSNGEVVHQWLVPSGEPTGESIRFGPRINVVAYSPSGDLIAVGGGDNTIRIYDSQTGLPHSPRVVVNSMPNWLSFSPAGHELLVGCIDRSVRFVSVADGRLTGAILRHAELLVGAAFAGTDRTIATICMDGTVRFWDLPGMPSSLVLRHQRGVLSAAFSPDGHELLTGSGLYNEDSIAQFWDTRTGEPLGESIHRPSALTAVAVSPDGTTFVTGEYGPNAVQRWDRATMQPLGDIIQEDSGVTVLQFHPDGRSFLSASFRDAGATVRDIHTGQLIEPPLHHPSVVRAAAFSRDGRMIATAGVDGTARLWDAATHRPIGEPLRHQGHVGAIAISPDSKTLLTGTDGKVAQHWDIASGRPVGSPFQHNGTVRSVSFSPDGRLIATGSWDRTARIWDPRTGKPIGPALHHDGEVEVAIFTPDGRRLLTASWDKTARFWPVPTPVEGSADQIRTWTAVLTGMELDANDAVRMLDADTWQERQRNLKSSQTTLPLDF